MLLWSSGRVQNRIFRIMQDLSCKTSRWRQLKAQLNNVDAEGFLALNAKYPEATIIDVRTPGETSSGSLKEAIHLDYLGYDFIDRLEEMDPEATYLVYCRSGRRSIRACTLMKNSGFTNVYNLDGGLVVWAEALQAALQYE